MDNYYVNLNHRELLVVSGEDSEHFLQGQLSCDLSKLSEQDSCLGCLCDNKGRVVASFTLWKLARVFYLEMEAGVAEIAEQYLKKYSVFYKSEITINNDAFFRVGIQGSKLGSEAQSYLTKNFPELPTSANQILLADKSYLRMADPENQRYELWQSNISSPGSLDLGLPEGNLENWKQLDQNLGLYRSQVEDVALYTPQELNYDQLGHISFTKGCYTGQEIVARMHYRGKAKKRLYLLQISTNDMPKKHMKVTTSDKKQVGEIIGITALSKNQFQVLAIANKYINQILSVEKLQNAVIKLISK